MKISDDHDIDALLRRQFEGPVSDEGFTARLIQQVPTRPGRAVWPLWAGIAAGIGACWLSLMSTPVLQLGWQSWLSGKPSSSAIILIAVAGGMSLLACWWTAMEADDS